MRSRLLGQSGLYPSHDPLHAFPRLRVRGVRQILLILDAYTVLSRLELTNIAAACKAWSSVDGGAHGLGPSQGCRRQGRPCVSRAAPDTYLTTRRGCTKPGEWIEISHERIASNIGRRRLRRLGDEIRRPPHVPRQEHRMTLV